MLARIVIALIAVLGAWIPAAPPCAAACPCGDAVSVSCAGCPDEPTGERPSPCCVRTVPGGHELLPAGSGPVQPRPTAVGPVLAATLLARPPLDPCLGHPHANFDGATRSGPTPLYELHESFLI